MRINEVRDLNCDGFIIGINNLSLGFSKTYTVDEIKKLKTEKELFIDLNKNIFNSDLGELTKVLKELDGFVTGIWFNDLGVLEICRRLGLKHHLYWHQNFLVVNYQDINFYEGMGIKGAVLANEITTDEIDEIINKTHVSLVSLLMGRRLEGVSKRSFLTNYFNYYEKPVKKSLKIRDIATSKEALIKEEEDTLIKDFNYFNGSSLLDKNLSYGYINEDDFEEEELKKIIFSLNRYIKTKDKKYLSDIEDIVGTDKGFLNVKTIYKVKR